VALTLLGLLATPPARAATPNSGFANEVYNRINQERQAEGVAPLGRVRLAELAAQLHAMDMANREYMAHYTAPTSGVTPDPVGYPGIRFTGGMGPSERLVASGYTAVSAGWGENVGYNYGYGAGSPADSVRRWMASGGHRANILDPDLKATGVGCAVSASGKVYYSQVFVVATSGFATITSNAQLWASAPPGPDSTAPGLWTAFGQSKASTQRSFRVQVSDGGSGLAPATAAFRYSTNGGATWSAWAAATCSGGNGSTTPQQITSPLLTLDFNSRYNRIQFRVADVAGNLGQSPAFTVSSRNRARARRR
jgi:uncharacterized protein YkwD